MHILKLVYLAHGWMLGIKQEPLIFEAVEAWMYGPVIPSLYHRYKAFGGGDIEMEIVDRSEEFSKKQIDITNAVIGAYEEYTALQLSDITHRHPEAPNVSPKASELEALTSCLLDRHIEIYDRVARVEELTRHLSSKADIEELRTVIETQFNRALRWGLGFVTSLSGLISVSVFIYFRLMSDAAPHVGGAAFSPMLTVYP